MESLVFVFAVTMLSQCWVTGGSSNNLITYYIDDYCHDRPGEVVNIGVEAENSSLIVMARSAFRQTDSRNCNLTVRSPDKTGLIAFVSVVQLTSADTLTILTSDRQFTWTKVKANYESRLYSNSDLTLVLETDNLASNGWFLVTVTRCAHQDDCSRRCIATALKCDGHNNCVYDEDNCPHKYPPWRGSSNNVAAVGMVVTAALIVLIFLCAYCIGRHCAYSLSTNRRSGSLQSTPSVNYGSMNNQTGQPPSRPVDEPVDDLPPPYNTVMSVETAVEAKEN